MSAARSLFVVGRHRGAVEDVAQIFLDLAIVGAARANPIVLQPQPFDLVGRARHEIHVAADEVGAIVEQRLEHHGRGRVGSLAEEQLGEFRGGRAAALLLRDFP